MTSLTSQGRAVIAPTDGEAVGLLTSLVGTPSVSGAERAAVEVFVRAAAAMGFEAAIDEAGNGIARRGPRARPDRSIALLGHIDTVPGHIPGRVESGILHGRGSVDAKGPLAAMLIAAARADLPEGVAVEVIAAVGEESPTSPGARFIAGRLRPDACIIGEPSGVDGVTLGYKGRLLCTASCERAGAHSAGPEPSPADTLWAWWARVLDLVGSLNAGHEGTFDTLQATIQACQSRTDGLERFACFEAGFRLPPWLGPGELAESLRGCIGAEPITLGVSGAEHAHATSRDDPVVRALSAAIRASGRRPRHKLKTGTADFNVVAPVWRCPIAAYGPGDSSLDHTPQERLHLAEYLASISILTEALGHLARELQEGTP